MNKDSILLLIANLISVVNLFLYACMYIYKGRKKVLLFQSLSVACTIVIYAISGCYSSVIANSLAILRNQYNSKGAPFGQRINFLILIVGCITTFFANGGLDDFSFYTYLPLLSLILCSIGVMFFKSAISIQIVTCFDGILWIWYDVENVLYVNVVTDILIIMMTIFVGILAFYDKMNAKEEKEDINVI